MLKRAWILCLSQCLLAAICNAQSLVPRAYVVAPVDSNAITVSYSFSDGAILFDPALPLEDTRGRISAGALTGYHSFGLLGRFANVLVSVPYTVANFDGTFLGEERETHRSGALDASARLSVNLIGGPAMTLKKYGPWTKAPKRSILGASLTVIAPTGQYDNSKLINPGSNRWSFKPELGFTQRWGHWILDAYGGVWLYTPNHDFLTNSPLFPGGRRTSAQEPIGSTEFHFSYDLKLGWWLSYDANYWYGGKVKINGVENPGGLQSNSRMGATFSMRVSEHQSMKFSYSQGALVRVGGDFKTVGIAWQYNWLGSGAMK